MTERHLLSDKEDVAETALQLDKEAAAQQGADGVTSLELQDVGRRRIADHYGGASVVGPGSADLLARRTLLGSLPCQQPQLPA